MIGRSTRHLTPAECPRTWRIPFTSWAIQIRGENECLVEILEFCVEKAWCVWGCDHGWGCCPSCLLLRTPDREFICLGGGFLSPPSSPELGFRWGSSRCDGDHAVVERWPNKQIYSVRFSGAPVKHVDLPWEARLVGRRVEREMPRLIGLRGCHVVDVESANDLPEDDPRRPEDEH
jgi:hypothetical protein